MSRLFLILFILFGFALHNGLEAQTGGRKREGSTKKRGKFTLKRNISKGHADKFARSSTRPGLFRRLFKKPRPAWTNRTTGSAKKNYKENRFLFFRHRSQGHIDNTRYQDKQNAKRARKREHGNDTFSKKKYKRK